MGRRRSWLSIVGLTLPLLSCANSLHSPQEGALQTVPLAGTTGDIRRFEGWWFDEEGLIAVVENGAEPRLAIRLRTRLSSFEIENARLQDKGSLRFDVRSDQLARTIPVVFGLAANPTSTAYPRNPREIAG